MKRRIETTGRSGLGLLLLAAGQRRGFGCFGTDADAYLRSLAPLLAFALVSSGLMAVKSPLAAASTFGLLLCQLLGPPVIADALCRRWKCRERWALYANILNWAPFLFVLLLMLAVLLVQVAIQAGVGHDAANRVGLMLLLGYTLWFQWFVARGALALNRKRTVVLLLATMLFGLVLYGILAVFGTGTPDVELKLK